MEKTEEKNYLDDLKKYVNYNAICSLMVLLSRLMNNDQGKKRQLFKRDDDFEQFPVTLDNGMNYWIERNKDEFKITCEDGRVLAVSFSLSPSYNRTTGEIEYYGRVNFRFEINQYSAIIFTDILDWITDYASVGELQVEDIKRIEPLYRAFYCKDYFRTFDLVTSHLVGNKNDDISDAIDNGIVIDNCVLSSDGSSIIYIRGKEESKTLPFMQEINRVRGILEDGSIKDYFFDEDELSLIVDQIDNHFGTQIGNNGDRLRKSIFER